MNLDHVFVCGNPALDFAATLRARRSARFEMFVTPERLGAWYEESGVVDAVTPGEDGDVQQARAVREAVYALITARRLGEEFGADALAVVNEAARRPSAVPQLTRVGAGPWRPRSRRCRPSPGSPSNCSPGRTCP